MLQGLFLQDLSFKQRERLRLRRYYRGTEELPAGGMYLLFKEEKEKEGTDI